MGVDDLRSKFRGTLLGAATGDGLGAPFEGSRSVAEDRLRRFTESTAPLRYTDDSHMMIGLAASILECGGLDQAHAAGVFARNYVREPWRGYGAGEAAIPREWIGRLESAERIGQLADDLSAAALV